MQAYLSDEHMAGIETGCPVSALGSEMPRQAPEVRRAATVHIKEMIDLFARQMPGWGQRARGIADSLPQSLRTEFNLFFNSLLAQALRQGQGATQAPMREALATAWGDAVVQRRWGRFARLVDEALARELADRLAREPMPGVQVVRHDGECEALAA